MDQSSFQNYINGDHDSLVSNIDLFRTLLPHEKWKASVHSGEEGRFIELVVIQYLKEKLPSGLGVASGFVVDIAGGWRSKQIDILIYDAATYAPLLKYGDAAILPIQSIIAAISIKRTLYKKQLKNEVLALTEIGSRAGGIGYPKPYLSIVAFDAERKNDPKGNATSTFESIKNLYLPRLDYLKKAHQYSWNELIDSVIVFDEFILKGDSVTAGSGKLKSDYVWTRGKEQERSLYIQHLLHGIHRAWYDKRRGNEIKRDLLAIPPVNMKQIGHIPFCTYDRPYHWTKIDDGLESQARKIFLLTLKKISKKIADARDTTAPKPQP